MSFLLLRKIYERKGDTQLAIENYDKSLDLWKNADEDLRDLIETKAHWRNYKKRQEGRELLRALSFLLSGTEFMYHPQSNRMAPKCLSF